MYYIIELQTNADGTAGNIVKTAEDMNNALSTYYGILQFAATSSVYIHTAVVFDEEGRLIAQKCFRHTPVVEPEPTEEPVEVTSDDVEP